MDILEAADMFHNRPGKDSRQENDFFGEIYETYRTPLYKFLIKKYRTGLSNV